MWGPSAYGPVMKRLLWVAFALSACPAPSADADSTGDRVPIEVTEASVACNVDAAGAIWSFALSVRGDATDDGARVFVESATYPDPVGHTLPFDDHDADGTVRYSATLEGATSGTGEPRDLPFDCMGGAPSVRFCVENRRGGDDCWLCDQPGDLPAGVLSFVDCTH